MQASLCSRLIAAFTIHYSLFTTHSSLLEWSFAHTTRGRECREERRERGYYNLHRQLNHPFLRHTLRISLFCLRILGFKVFDLWIF